MKRQKKPSRFSFKWKLVGVYSLIMVMTSAIMALLFYYISVDQVVDVSKDMAYEILQKNMQILDERLIKIQENSKQAVTDYGLFAYLSDEEALAKENYLGLDRKITQVLSKYFPSADIMSVQLITDRYTYGVNTSLLTAHRFKESPLYREVLEQSGALIWTPVYDIVNMYDLEEYGKSALPNRWVFSAARTLGIGYIDSEGVFETQSLGHENLPVLLINFSENVISNIFRDSMPVQGAETYLLSPGGELIYHSSQEPVDAAALSELYKEIGGKERGTDIIRLNGEDTAVSYVASSVTGWLSVAVMPSNALMQTTRVRMQATTAVSGMGVMIVGILLSIMISSMVARPIHRTVAAMQKLGSGQFETELKVESRDEFGYLVEGFNTMNRRITRLIEDNYASKLRENEMEIMALNLQLNPHFLHNTLTVINYEALETGRSRVSDMIMHLCDMLSYTFRNQQETSRFRDDLEWVQNYVDIMMYRFERKFTVCYEIDEALLEIQVPKLFLQPFIENAILHGFEFIDSGGIIKVRGRREDHRCVIEVCDNGIGMESPEGQPAAKRSAGSIGIANIHQRIQLLYGVDYGVKIVSKLGEGTTVMITLPVNSKP